MRFEVGDKVRRSGRDNRYMDGRVLKVGTVCVVTKVGNVSIEVEADGVTYEGNDPGWFELVSEENNMEEDVVNHPNHYNANAMECIDEMVLVFGKEAVINFCRCNAWKYRYRSEHKNGDEDLKKADWYIAKIKELEGVE